MPVIIVIVIVIALLIGFAGGKVQCGGHGKQNGTVPPKIKKLESPNGEDKTTVTYYVSKQGVSEDKFNWVSIDQFESEIEKCKAKGVKHINYELERDSIHSVEEAWEQALKKTVMSHSEQKK